MSKNIDYEQLSALAYLAESADSKEALASSINAIMDFVDILRQEDTTDIPPLFHPLNIHQRLREDNVSEQNEAQALKEIATLFDENLYWVPKVIDSGQ